VYTIRRVQLNQDGLKLNGIDHLLVYADDVNTMGRSVHTIKKNTEYLVIASKEIHLQVNADRTKYKVMSQDQNARSHNIKVDDNSFEEVLEFRYLRTLTNQHSIQEEIKSRQKAVNAYCHLVQNLLSSHLLSNILKIKI
jgi:hypothetical protein